mmetsp:Transcript_67422/g.197145  ORF Transcript_67422/g.197145 Transcript_67422/m.197145 type:complete len:340 (+) Transcript_67422:58-1077(+)
MAWGSGLLVMFDAVLSGKTSYILAFSILLPAILAILLFQQQKRPAEEPGKAPPRGAPKAEAAEDSPQSLSEEPWCPKLELRDWQQAGDVPGCPWHFDGCETLEDALGRIWRSPVHSELEAAFETLKARVRALQVARMSVAFPREEVRYAAIYTLLTGAELFGGEPVECGAPAEREESAGSGLRQRGAASQGGTGMAKGQGSRSATLPSSLVPFFKIHDGFGVLLSTRHLPLLLCNPEDTVNGSCYYVYPMRGFETMRQLQHLFRFARVDRNCVACSHHREDRTSVVYVEASGESVEEDESPLTFIADTVSNIAGNRVVPPSYLGGPGPFGVTALEGHLG